MRHGTITGALTAPTVNVTGSANGASPVWSGSSNGQALIATPTQVTWTGIATTFDYAPLGQFLAINDQVDASGAINGTTVAFFSDAVNTGHKGPANGVYGKVAVQSNPSSNGEYHGGMFIGIIESGVSVTGNVYGGIMKTIISGTVSGMDSALELAVDGNGTIGSRFQAYGKLYTTSTSQGSNDDAALAFFADSAQSTTYGHLNGLQFGVYNDHFPLATTANVINLKLGLDASATLGSIVNIPANFTVSNYYWNSPNWTMTGAGVSSQAGNATIASSQTNPLILQGGNGAAIVRAGGSGTPDLRLQTQNSSAVVMQTAANGYNIFKAADGALGAVPNYIQITNASTGNTVSIGPSSGSVDANTGLNLVTQGTGVIQINGTPGVTCSGTPTASFAVTKGVVTHC